MELNLGRLEEMHPLLSQAAARDYAHKAAIGLERHDHVPGVPLAISADGIPQQGALYWLDTQAGDDALYDTNRVTEDAAEAIALVLVHVANGWVVRRRLQRGEFADWLLVDRDRRLVAMEVSGIGAVDVGGRRLRDKIGQVEKCQAAGQRAVCVAELSPPRVTLAMV
jgi:hypothetical protein